MSFRPDPRLTTLLPGRRWLLGISVGTGSLAGWAAIGQVWFLAQAIHGVFREGMELREIAPWLLLSAGFALGRAGSTWIGQAASSRLAGEIQQELRRRLSSHLDSLGPLFAAGERSGELVHGIANGAERLEPYFSQYLPQLFLAVLIPAGILAAVFPVDLLSGFVLLLTGPLIPFFAILIGRGAGQVAARQWQTLSRLSAHFLDLLQGLKTLKILGRSQDQVQVIAQVSDRHRQATLQVLRIAFSSALTLELVAALSTAVVAVEIGLQLLCGRLEFAPALFVLLLAPEFYLPLRKLGAGFHASTEGMAAARQIFQLLERPAVSWGNAPWQGSFRRLVFEQVSFAYDPQRLALTEICFELRAGQTVALVGPSGAGKSTIANLLLGFATPTAGQILVDGRSLVELDLEAWRQQVAWVPARPHLFYGSIADNLRLACPEATQDELIAAARLAHLHDFVANLPRGYDTLVGEEGARLSQGEIQRLALARAFLKDAPLLVLDEPTANLDPQTEDQIRASLRALRSGRTVLLIAHRLNTAQEADWIVVLEKGRVCQQGTAAMLLAQEGLYRRMATAYWQGIAA